MEGLKIIINGEVCELDKNSITLNDVKFNPTDITLRNVPFSYSLTLPMSKKNDRIFKNIKVLDVIGKFVKDFKGEVYFGDDLIFGGNVIINSLNKKGYSINIISDELDWTKEMGGKTLKDLNLSTPFTAVWNSSNSNLPDGGDYASYTSSKDRLMNFPLIGYGNFFQTYDVKVFQLFDNGFLSGELQNGTYMTDDDVVFYLDDRDTLLPSGVFSDGTIFKLKTNGVVGTQDFQVKVVNPEPDNYIGKTDFTIEEYPPSFYINPILKRIFYENGLKVVFDGFQKTEKYLMPFVGERVSWNWGLLGDYKGDSVGFGGARDYPRLLSSVINEGYDVITLDDFEVFSGGGNLSGIYTNTIGSEPCSQWTMNPAYVSQFDNYKDGMYVVDTVQGFVSWYGYLFFINNATKSFDYTENYSKYLGLTTLNNYCLNRNNIGHYYRCPVKAVYTYKIDFAIDVPTHSWNPNNLSQKFVGETLPFYFLVIKNEDFKTNIENLYNGIPFNENVLFSQSLLAPNNAVITTAYSFDLSFDLERDTTLTACFVSYQQTTLDFRSTGNHYYQPALLSDVVLRVTPNYEYDFDLGKNLPEINQLEFVKDYMKTNNLFPVQKGDTVYFKSWDAYQSEPNIVLTDRMVFDEVEKVEVYDHIEYEFTEDTNDYLITDENRSGAVKKDFANYYKSLLNKNDKKYNFKTLFSPTTDRVYQVLNLADGLVDISLPCLSTKDSFETDPRFVNTVYNFNSRILEYDGETDRKIKIMGKDVMIGNSHFPNAVYMKEVYGQKYSRMIEKINLSHIITAEIYLEPNEYKKFKNSLGIVDFNGDKYYVIQIEYVLPSKKAKVSLLKKL